MSADAVVTVVSTIVVFLNIPTQTEVNELKNAYKAAKPFPHVVIDSLVSSADSLSDLFPGPSWDGWDGLGDAYQKNKFICSDIEMFPQAIKDVVVSLNSPRFLHFLEAITGTKKLIPDPYLSGGGLHLSTAGGILSPHTDFHLYKKLDLFRRINLILYLNSSWTSGDGGELELSSVNQESPTIRVEPVVGRVIIFQTDDRSIHGFTNPVKDGTMRKSIALYYYTSKETAVFSGDETTHWREHLGLESSRRLRYFIYKALLGVSRAFSIVAHLVNPNQGLGLVKQRLKITRRGKGQY